MSETPSLPPTPERLALARRAGIVPLARSLTAAAALAATAATLAWTGATVARALAALTRDGVAAAVRPGAGAVNDPATAAAALPLALAQAVSLAAPLLLAAAATATLVHLAQTRTPWLPRRRIRGAPEPRAGASRRVADALLGLLAVAAVVATGARFAVAHGADLVRAGASPRALALVAVALVQIAAALLAVAALDAVVRVVRHAVDLRMTSRQHRDAQRATAADPRWRRARRDRAGDGSAAAIAGCALVIADDRSAAAIRWHPRWSPVPRLAVAGRDRASRAIIAAARRHRVPVQHDPDLATALAPLASGAPVPATLHARLARHLAAVSR